VAVELLDTALASATVAKLLEGTVKLVVSLKKSVRQLWP
jgi:hypothetical protein